MPHAAIPFRPHHRFAVPLPRSRRGGFSFTVCRLLSPMRGTRAAAKYRRSVKGLRYFSFPRRCGGSGERSEPIGAPMPHAALWLVQLERKREKRFCACFNAARGFVGGATIMALVAQSKSQSFQCRTRLCGWCSRWGLDGSLLCSAVSMPHAAIPFRPHHRFAVPLPRSRRGGLVRLRFLVESRNISFPRQCGGSGERSEPIGAPMPHAALWVVQRVREQQRNR